MSYDVLTPAAARLWPYAPDWSRSFDVTRSYKTDIFTSRDGTEQRRAIRDAPRLSAQATRGRQRMPTGARPTFTCAHGRTSRSSCPTSPDGRG
jgi:hypothetical protein